MNSSTFVLYITVFNGTISIITIETKLTGINDSPHVEQLYVQVRNQDPPPQSDPALADARIRKNICEDISNSGFVDWHGKKPVDTRRVDPVIKQAQYSNFFHQIYSRRESKNRLKNLLHPFKYTNQFTQEEFRIVGIMLNRVIRTREYTFLCLLKERMHHNNTIRIFPFYISKEYNVFHERRGTYYLPGRFIFWNHKPDGGLRFNEYMLLAEEPAKIYDGVSQEYNVELHYLRTRKYRRPAETRDLDPLCRLVPEANIPADVLHNQHYRLCVAVLRSSSFKKKFAYPRRSNSSDCFEKEISFRTKEAIRESAGRPYYERMINCECTTIGSEDDSIIYISRAYMSNRVFVYSYSSHNDTLYLENLSTNISIFDEAGFDDVEE